MATAKGGGGGEAWHFKRDAYYPTAPKAIERMKRGDIVPPAECGYRVGREGVTCRQGDFDPFVWESLLRNGLVTRGAGREPDPVPEAVVVQAAPVAGAVKPTDDAIPAPGRTVDDWEV